MKKTLRVIGSILILLSITLFLYGSVKTSKAADEERTTTKVDEDIIVVEKNTQKEAASQGFTTSLVLGVIGIVVLLASGRPSSDN